MRFTSNMRFTSKLACAMVIVAATAMVASAADARRYDTYRRDTYHRDAPYAFGGAYAAYGYTGGSERSYGTSVPYNADGPSYNDFQLQGK
jgi:hypothetical protein